jgi:hypothetical protein
MRTRVEKAQPRVRATKPTLNSEPQSAPEMTARMHFYAVRNTGDQLRWDDTSRIGKKPDRMVGR